MIDITNTLFQPLTLQTSSGAGIHLPPRGRMQLADADVSEEMRRAARRGFIRLQPAQAVLSGQPGDEVAMSKATKRKEG